MKWLKVPTGDEKPSWPGLWGTVSMAYLFVDPWQRDASWVEWLWTGLAFAIFMLLATLSCIYWARQRVMQWVCLALALLAVSFGACRPAGIFFFVFVAAFGPLAAGGSIAGSAVIVGITVLLIFGQWQLFWSPSAIPYVAALEAFLVGGAITFVLRQQAAMKRTVKTAERERIARDLHDILGHTLSVIIMKSELAGRLLERDPLRAQAQIGEVERIARQALSEVREAISGYRAGDLRTEFERAQSALETAGVAVERHCEQVAIPVAQERVLALVLREAVTNVMRHAQATRCVLSLRQTDGLVHMEVRDDGRGGVHPEGNGMRGIRERVAAVGGEATWLAGTGTVLTIALPVTATEVAG